MNMGVAENQGRSHCIHGAGMEEIEESERDGSQLYRAGKENFSCS